MKDVIVQEKAASVKMDPASFGGVCRAFLERFSLYVVFRALLNHCCVRGENGQNGCDSRFCRGGGFIVWKVLDNFVRWD